MSITKDEIKSALVSKRAEEIYEKFKEPKYKDAFIKFTKDFMTNFIEGSSDDITEAVMKEKIYESKEFRQQVNAGRNTIYFFRKYYDNEAPKLRKNELKVIKGAVYNEMRKELVESGDFKETKDDMKELSEDLDEVLETVFSDDAIFEKMAQESAEREYMTSDEINNLLGQCYNFLKSADVEISIIKDIKEKMDSFKTWPAFERKERLVNRLYEIADTEGIEKAISKKTRNKILKEIYPTADEYAANVKEAYVLFKEFSENIKSSLMMDGAEGRAAGGIIGAMQKSMEGLGKVYEQMVKDEVMEQTKEIYGTAKEIDFTLGSV